MSLPIHRLRCATTILIVLLVLAPPAFPKGGTPGAEAHVPSQWLMYQGNLGRTGFNPTEKILRPPLRVRWKRPVGRTGFDAPLIRDGRVYVASSTEAAVLAFDLASGRQQWRFPFGMASKTGASTAEMAFGTDVLYLSTRDRFFALAEGGQVLWCQPVTLTGRLTVAKNVVILDLDYRVVALSADTGARLWEAPEERVEYGLIAGKLLLVGGEAKPPTALEVETGQLAWRVLVEGIFVGGASHDDSRLYALRFEDWHLFAFELGTGRQVWEFSRVKPWKYGSGPAVAEGSVYFLNGDEVIAADAVTGTERWRSKVGYKGAWSSPPVIANGVVYMGTNRIACLDAQTGHLLQTVPVKGLVHSALAIGEGALAFVDGRGVLTILESQRK